MIYPKFVLEVIDEVESRHKEDIDAAVAEAEARLRAMGDKFNEFVDILIRSGIREAIYQKRCQVNVQIRRSLGGPNPPKVNMLNSKTAQKTNDEIYNYRIDGQILGMLTRLQLREIADAKRKTAATSTFQASLCDAIADAMTDDDRTVQQSIKKGKLKAIWDGLIKPELAAV